MNEPRFEAVMNGNFQVKKVIYTHMIRYNVTIQAEDSQYVGQSSTIIDAMSDALRTMHADKRKK